MAKDSLELPPKNEAIENCHAFVAAGGSHIDTANAYAGVESERIIGEAEQAIGRDKVTLASKARFATSVDSHFGAGLSRKVIKTQIEQMLTSLKTDYLDLYYMHGWDPHTPIEESLRAYEDLVQEGKVLYLGVSNFRAWQVMQSLGVSETLGLNRFVAAQYQYSLVQRDIDNEYMSLFADQGLSCMAWGHSAVGF